MQDQNFSQEYPPFSPVLLAGIALSPLPIRFFAPIAKYMLGRVIKLYPDVFKRLEPLGHCRFAVRPSDLPCCFLLELDHGKAQLSLFSRLDDLPVSDATISGPISSLVLLLEGKVDGDALFFSRELAVSGDTEAVLTLRNAIDSADISLEEIWLGETGFLRPITGRALSGFAGLYEKANRDLSLIKNALISPVTRQHQLLEDDLDRQQEQLDKMEKEVRKIRAQNARAQNARTPNARAVRETPVAENPVAENEED
ncbi:SCP2 sterol-binding domain-containing protein [Kiloniella laminariae]|uniref:SCP2 sterol-binding domain-containing protein n=1 Tax=Kiloniella laminariae TaxID=454162 RepID=A0ABT4LHU7_9PROT|nr:SCP2 sterol-binding domain-containing protein [Kiloniella laminariae]MCZ4280679.1 SCP2 sterol-binding domain-containing protein [Kiloniella laminariae]